MDIHDQRQDVIGGILLGVAALIAIVVVNSPLSNLYDALLSTRLDISIAPAGGRAAFGLGKPLILWINDGLMALFFFAVGLEIKREFVEGSLSGVRRAILPAVAALGGVAVPALVFLVAARGNTAALRGWAIPTATDIAFVVAIAAALGRAVPAPLKIFLLALAIIDDLIAILVIAAFYTDELSGLSLVLAASGLAALAGLNASGVRRLAPYALVGLFTWVCVLKSGVHATLAGVAVGLAIPLTRGADGESLLDRTEHALKPWVTYAILPIFAFANAGISFAGLSPELALGTMPLAIGLGLFVGKQAGVFGFAYCATRLGAAELPPGVTVMKLYGAAILTGIGFTMSLFIGTLGFDDSVSLAQVRIGVIAGSVASALAGVGVLLLANRGKVVAGVAATG
jgi:Na+:H+ antiporter, NhaA family